MTRSVEFWFEFASTYSYPAAMQIEEMASARACKVLWRPFLLGPVFKAHGLETSPFILNPVKGAYMWRDLERICERAGLPFRKPSEFPRGSLLASRVVCRFAEAPWIGDFVRGVYSASFAHDAEIGTAPTITGLLEGLGQNAETTLTEAQNPENKAALCAQTERALALGIFGAPTILAAGEMFWGHDRVEAALEWACDPAKAG